MVLAAAFLFLLSFTTACQRDDICPESTVTTPLLPVFFMDAEETDISKSAPRLRVRATEYDSIYINSESISEIAVPLRTDSDFTDYDLTINAPAVVAGQEPDDTNANRDQIRITYSREEEYLNRACGYRMNYSTLAVTRVEDENNWIQRIIIQNTTIENEIVTRLVIYH